MKQKTLIFIRLICLCILSITTVTGVNAQNLLNIKGTVKDKSGEAIIGASVMIAGTTNGSITDVDGNFSLSNVPSNGSIKISYLGYTTVTLPVNSQTSFKVTMFEDVNELEEVTIVAYGTQKKQTLTGAISSVGTDALLSSPNASIANSLAGKITGLSSVQSTGQPGNEDPKIFVRGVGSLTEDGASPLILVDGVERAFFQMDPNEIENITVLKDASATAVFGVRGANGVVLVTTRRGVEGRAKISVNSSIGIQKMAKWVDMTDAYTYAMMYNEQETNDSRNPVFDDYSLERFRLGDSPIMYPNMDWKGYMMKKASIQTQHNLNISGGTEGMRYFISVGYLYQDGLLKDFGQGNGYQYNRYNYRANLDFDVSKTTVLKMGIGGVVGDRQEPYNQNTIWKDISIGQPISGPGLVNGLPMTSQPRYQDIRYTDPFANTYGNGTVNRLDNKMNLDLHLVQKLDMLTKGLSAEVKGAYNTGYVYTKKKKGNIEIYTPFFESELDGSGLQIGDPAYNYNIVHRITGTNSKSTITEEKNRSRDWYFEASLRYNRKFGNHNVGALLLYNQTKKYYPKQLPYVANAYIGLVGRATYDYKSRYLAEFNIGYNGSENFAPEKRFGTFPAFSLGWVVSEEGFMKGQKVIDFLKLRGSVGLVGNDNMSNNRFLYLPDSYNVDMKHNEGGNWKEELWGYNFGLNNSAWYNGAVEQRLGNRHVTWETALKQNYGIDLNVLGNRLKITAEYFNEKRKDILIARQTVPGLTSLTKEVLPVVNMGEVKNHGYELEIGWDDRVSTDFHYYINANMSYSKNEIIFQDEVEPNEPYLWRTGRSVGAIFGYVADGFYAPSDFVNGESGELVEGLPKPQTPVFPGDVKYLDLNNDNVIDPDDQRQIGYPTRPNYTFGLNYGADYKGFFFSMNWTGTAERSIALVDQYRKPFNGESRGLMQYQVDGRWTPETAETALYPRFSKNSLTHNSYTSTLWVKNGSYLKLKNLTVGYNFTQNPFLKKLGITQLGVKFTGYNLLCFDSVDVIDPEFVASFNDTRYPVTRQYVLGLNITF